MIGVTSLDVGDETGAFVVPHTMSAISENTWFIAGSSVWTNKAILKENYSVNLSRLGTGDRLGVRVTSERSLKLFINGEDMGVAAPNLPKVYK